jgi:hypothetical protein
MKKQMADHDMVANFTPGSDEEETAEDEEQDAQCIQQFSDVNLEIWPNRVQLQRFFSRNLPK